MACVQAWEGDLAALVGAVRLKPPNSKPVPLDKTLGKLVNSSWHLLHKASASELKKMLAGQPGSSAVSEALLEEIGKLI